MIQPAQPPVRPISARAAENGLVIGLYVSVLLLCTGLSLDYSIASFVVLIGSGLFPVYVFAMLRRSQKAADYRLSFIELWAEGVASFFLGSLIPAVLTYVALKYWTPDFISRTFAQSVDVLRQLGTAESESLAEAFEGILKAGRIPTATDMAAEVITLNLLAGTFLSLLAAIIVKAGVRPSRSNNTI